MTPSSPTLRLTQALRLHRASEVLAALEEGASPDEVVPLTAPERNRWGAPSSTALGVALKREQWDCAEVLLAFGADPWAAPQPRGTSFRSQQAVSAWSIVASDHLDTEGAALDWLIHRRPEDVRPSTLPPGRHASEAVWWLLAQRAAPAALLRVMARYRPQNDGPVEASLRALITARALSKGSVPDESESRWLTVIQNLFAFDPQPVPPSEFRGLARSAAHHRNRAAFVWALDRMDEPLWRRASARDVGWEAARTAAQLGWGDALGPFLAAASASEAWSLLLEAASSADPLGFSALLSAHPAIPTRLGQPKYANILLDQLLTRSGTPAWADLPATLAAAAAAGASFQPDSSGKNPSALQRYGTCLNKAKRGSRRTAEAIATALLRAGAPFDEESAAALRPHVPHWVARREARTLGAALIPSVPTARRPRF